MPEQPSLDDVFSGILNDQSLQQQVKEAEEKLKRAQEIETNKPFDVAGGDAFVISMDHSVPFSKEGKQGWEQLQDKYHLQIPHPNTIRYATSNDAAVYVNAIQKIIEVKGISGYHNKGWSRIASAPADLRYFFKGFGMVALSRKNISAALLALDEGN